MGARSQLPTLPDLAVEPPTGLITVSGGSETISVAVEVHVATLVQALSEYLDSSDFAQGDLLRLMDLGDKARAQRTITQGWGAGRVNRPASPEEDEL